MKIIIYDDDRSVVEQIAEIIKKRYSNTVELTLCVDTTSFLNHVAISDYDLAFIDIVLGDEDGIEVVRRSGIKAPVVFITAYVMRYAEEIFKGVIPYGFISKPVYSSKLYYYIDRLSAESQKERSVIRVYSSGNTFELLQSDIIYMESDKRQVFIHTTTDIVTVYERLDNIQSQADERFVRCHQSYMVNMDHISELDGEYFILDNGQAIRISRSRCNDSKKQYFGHYGRRML